MLSESESSCFPTWLAMHGVQSWWDFVRAGKQRRCAWWLKWSGQIGDTIWKKTLNAIRPTWEIISHTDTNRPAEGVGVMVDQKVNLSQGCWVAWKGRATLCTTAERFAHEAWEIILPLAPIQPQRDVVELSGTADERCASTGEGNTSAVRMIRT